ncbi:hypothetical protein V8C86DRAFT_2460810 [Haematococcus lacustris]
MSLGPDFERWVKHGSSVFPHMAVAVAGWDEAPATPVPHAALSTGHKLGGPTSSQASSLAAVEAGAAGSGTWLPHGGLGEDEAGNSWSAAVLAAVAAGRADPAPLGLSQAMPGARPGEGGQAGPGVELEGDAGAGGLSPGGMVLSYCSPAAGNTVSSSGGQAVVGVAAPGPAALLPGAGAQSSQPSHVKAPGPAAKKAAAAAARDQDKKQAQAQKQGVGLSQRPPKGHNGSLGLKVPLVGVEPAKAGRQGGAA